MNKAEELRKIADVKKEELDKEFLENIKTDRKYLQILKEVEEAANSGLREKSFNFEFNGRGRLENWEIYRIERAFSLQGFRVKKDSYGLTTISF